MYRLKDGSLTKNIIDTWLDKTTEELGLLQGAGLLPPYVQAELKKREASQRQEASPKTPTPKKPRKKAVKKAATVASKK